MNAAPLECPNCYGIEHVRPCVRSLACWWKEVCELEKLLGYSRSSLRARDAWDELVASEVPSPQPALYIELRSAADSWRRATHGQRVVYPSLLDQFVETADREGLTLPNYSVLAAFRLDQRVRRVR